MRDKGLAACGRDGACLLQTERGAGRQAVEDMCLHRMADRLYASLQRECDAHISRQLADLAASQTADPTLFLQQVAPAGPEPGVSVQLLMATLASAEL